MSKWEDQVKVSLDSIFDDADDGVDMSNSKKNPDPYSKMNEDEINEVYDLVNDEAYLEDLDKYYSVGEQMDLASEGIHLTIAKKYHLETGKKPIWKKRVTNKFRDWLKTNYPDLVELLAKNKGCTDPECDILNREKSDEKVEIIEEKLLTTYEHALTWLYRFMSNLKFVDYTPTDDDLEKIQKIDELVNNG